MSDMTERDWDIYLSEHSNSVDDIAELTGPNYPDGPEFKGYEERSSIKSERNQVFEYIRVEKQTPKAKFFVTHETLGEIHGFWCPKAAIVVNEGKVVKVAHWCRIKIIQFV